MKPNISILIITYNRPGDLMDLLKSINTQEYASDCIGEILILNNASEKSYDIVKKFISENKKLPVRFINHQRNLGVAAGRNFLIKKASYPVLMVLDDDVVFENDESVRIAASVFNEDYFESNNTAVITMNIFYYDNGERQKNAFPHKSYADYRDKSRFLTSYFTGAAHLMKKELFNKTGYYPEDFFYGMEEYDLSYRVIENGYSLAFDDRIRILHKESPEGRVPPREKLRMMWYNKCVVTYRYLPIRFYFSTWLLWAFEYLRKSGYDVRGMIGGLIDGLKVPYRITRQRVGPQALRYLREARARLWY